MQFQDFQNFALTTEQTNTISGGGWRDVKKVLSSKYGTKMTGMTSETASSFNPITGQMVESDMISLTVEFADGTGITMSIHKKQFDLCCDRITRIYA